MSVKQFAKDIRLINDWFETNPGFSDEFCNELVEAEDASFARLCNEPCKDLADLVEKVSILQNDRMEGRNEVITNLTASILRDIRALAGEGEGRRAA